jgi:anti-sigma-K factor RskA
MNCEQAEELIGAFALDALAGNEAAEFRAHITTCAEHAARSREMRVFASALAGAVEPVTPPAGLRSRVLSAVAATPQEATPDRTPRPIRLGATEARRARPAWLRPRPAHAWGALAAAAIGGLLLWNVLLQTGGGGLNAEDADSVNALLARDVPVGSVLYFEDEGKAVVVAEVPELAPGTTYQMWAISDGTPSSLGTMAPDADGRARSVVPFDADHSDLFAVTVEPAGGSDQPTSEPLFVASIRS